MIKHLLAGAVAILLSPVFAAQAVTHVESPDAGESAGAAQAAIGADRIVGVLFDTGENIPDIDVYKINVGDVDAFSVTLDSDPSIFRSEFFLFDAALDVALEVEVSGFINETVFGAGDLSGFAGGIYYLAMTINESVAASGGVVSIVGPQPFQSGGYTLALTGVAVPAPYSLPLLLSACAGMMLLRRPRRHRR